MSDGRPADGAKGDEIADVCLIVEGAYPYVQGGVSSWTQDLILNQPHLRFHLLVIVAPGPAPTLRYKLPANVCGVTHVVAAELPRGRWSWRVSPELLRIIHEFVDDLLAYGRVDDLRRLVLILGPHRHALGRRQLLDSPEAFAAFQRLYERACAGASTLNAFWGWRTLVGGLLGALLAPLPPARVYHTISTGYAGLIAARAAVETGRPALITEHGIYTNERRLEILAAPWLAVDDSDALTIEGTSNAVKQLWIDAFVAYARVCYAACDPIITLFEGNHPLQVEDGADPRRLSVIPNGIDLRRYEAIVRVPNAREGGSRPQCVALIGRVVPIKDIKTFLRACALMLRQVPDAMCYVLGPADEDPPYAAACHALVDQLGIGGRVVFTGMVNLMEWFGKIDVVVLTSLSEAQPLVILEGGAAGVPSIATDVGACRELILGRSDEAPRLGTGGRVTPLGNPAAIAAAMSELLLDEPLRQRCGEVMRRRVRDWYDKDSLHRRYASLYERLRTMPGDDDAERGR